MADPDKQRMHDQLGKLEEVFLDCSKPFSCSGTVSCTTPAALFYRDGDSTSTALLPLSDNDIAKLYAAGDPSPFGRNKELVHDESYRAAHELKPPHFALSLDPVLEGNILSVLQDHLERDSPLQARVNKLNCYATGGFFKAHRDTPHGNNHIGTLTVCLPSTFTGGELVVRHRGKSITYTWGTDKERTQSAQPNDTATVFWAFLYSDCEHEVLPVTSGTRVTIAYDILTVAATEAEDTGVTPAYNLLRSLVADNTFYPNGCTLAFGLQHAYPCETFNHDKDFAARLARQLKGQDRAWLQVFKGSKLDWQVKAVYDVENDEDNAAEDRVDELPEAERLALKAEYKALQDALNTELAKYGKDAEGEYVVGEKTVKKWWSRSRLYDLSLNRVPTSDERADLKKLMKDFNDDYGRLEVKYKLRKNPYCGRSYVASDDFYLYQGAYVGDYGDDPLSGAKDGEDAEWVTEPGSFGGRNHYISYGNEPDSAVMYVGAAIFVTLPPAAERKHLGQPADDASTSP